VLLATSTPSPLSDPGGLDDPKLARGTDAAVQKKAAEPEHPAPAVKLSYRRLSMPNLDGSDLPFNSGQIDMYAISRRWVRIGIEAEVGTGKGTLDGKPSSAWYLAAGLTAGIQYPWRVTPFVEGRFIAGFIGGDIAGQTALSYTYQGGIDSGIELYLVDRFYLSAAIGWVHPVYRGVDFEYARAHPTADPMYRNFASDAFTFKIGLGL
jgi:hypothetical protein